MKITITMRDLVFSSVSWIIASISLGNIAGAPFYMIYAFAVPAIFVALSAWIFDVFCN